MSHEQYLARGPGSRSSGDGSPRKNRSRSPAPLRDVGGDLSGGRRQDRHIYERKVR